MEKKSHWSNFRRMKLRKTFLFMKCFILFFLFSLSGMASSYSQNMRVTLSLDNMALTDVLAQIRQESGYTFIYNADDLRSLKIESLHVTDASIEEVLSICLQGTGFNYKIEDNVVVISLDEMQQENESVVVKGKVIDKYKRSIPGVTVIIQGTMMGTTTGADGTFALEIPQMENMTLLFSFIGMKSVAVKYTGQETLQVVMEKEVTEIDEVVVTGYQTIDRRKNTSAVTSVKAEDIMIPGVTSIDQMLQGQIPDLISMTNSGEIGVAPKLRIRGTSTLIGNREPLWVIDGIIQHDPVNISPEELNDPDYINRIGNAISGLNPQDIERIDVLKDAAATALYGTKAANGVIVITTKRGHVGDPIVSYNMTATLKLRPRYTNRNIDVMTSKERVAFSRDLISNNYKFDSGMSLVGYEMLTSQLYNQQITYDQFVKEVYEMEARNTDWFDILGNDVVSHQHTLSVTGRSEQVRYYASIGYTHDNDVVQWNKNDRYTGMLKVDLSFSDAFSAAFDLGGNKESKKYYQNEIAPIDYAYNTSRTIPLRNPDGTLYYYQRNYSSYFYNFNILNELEHSGNEQESSNINFQANLRYSPLQWLKLNGTFAYTISNTELDSYWGAETYHASTLRYGEYGGEIDDASQCTLPGGGELTQSRTRNEYWTLRFQADVNKYFGRHEQHNITASVGIEASSTKYKGTESVNRGYYPDRGLQFAVFNVGDYPAYDTWLAGNKPVITDNLTNLFSGYASVSYTYRNFITLNANGRYDGSNKFGSQSNEKLLPVWSASLAYNPIEQFGGLDFFDYLQLKFSYGYQGNMLDDQSPEVIIRKLPMDDHFDELVAEVDIYPNPDLKWERTSSLNGGIEFSILNRRLMVSSDVYYKKTKDAFLKKNISQVNGLDAYTVNSGEITNKGYNVSLTVSPVYTEKVRWMLSTSISKSYNKVETQASTDQYDLENFLNGTVITAGEPVNTFFSYKFRGLSPVNGGPLFDDYEEMPEKLYGKSKYEVFTTVLEASGSREPKLSGGINNTVNFFNFRLNLNLSYSLGAKTRLFKLYDGERFNAEQNVNRAFLNRWQRPGDEAYTNIPAAIDDNTPGYTDYAYHWSSYTGGLVPQLANTAWDMYNYSNIRVVNANYLKCTNLSLTYMFPEELLSKWKLDRLELSLSTTNLFTIASPDLKGQTPTQGGFTDIQLSERPTFSLGLNVSF